MVGPLALDTANVDEAAEGSKKDNFARRAAHKRGMK